jgi:hypothetical protein
LTRGGYERGGFEKRWKDHQRYAINNIQGRGARALINSIVKYGGHNHKIKPILTCPTAQANYWEIKYIRQYNTQVPNGLNIMKGGKNAPLAEETKRKLSEATKGKRGGANNPMWGKQHSKETVDKIRDALIGKPLSNECKSSMSAAHAKNKSEGKLPPRRKHTDLPKYIYHVRSHNKEGYEVRHHPTLKQKQFTQKTIPLEQNLERAKAYLADPEIPENQKVVRETQDFTDLPRYVRQIRSEKFEGFEVKCHPTLPNKKWTNMKLSMEEKLQLAKRYLDEGSETKSLSVNGNKSLFPVCLRYSP